MADGRRRAGQRRRRRRRQADRRAPIGYVELNYATQTAARLRRSSRMPPASSSPAAPTGVTAAAEAAVADFPADFRQAPIINGAGDTTYPIASYTYLLVSSRQTDADKGQALVVVHLLGPDRRPGRRRPALGYAPLPAPSGRSRSTSSTRSRRVASRSGPDGQRPPRSQAAPNSERGRSVIRRRALPGRRARRSRGPRRPRSPSPTPLGSGHGRLADRLFRGGVRRRRVRAIVVLSCPRRDAGLTASRGVPRRSGRRVHHGRPSGTRCAIIYGALAVHRRDPAVVGARAGRSPRRSRC